MLVHERLTAMIELIINPVAGNGLAKKIGREAEDMLRERKINFASHTTTHPGHATELARAAAMRGAETVVAFGGDGTITEVGAGLRNTGTALGIVPAGTGNDFIKAVGIPTDWKEALLFILTHRARPVNTGMMNDRFFLNVSGSGFDVMVLSFAERAKKHVRGIWPYLYGVLRAITAFRPMHMHVTIGEDEEFNRDCMLCSIGNGRFIGGGIPITPLADVTDGMFDVLVVDAVKRWRIPFYLPSLMTGTLHNRKIAHRYLAQRCSLAINGMHLQLDGEIISVDSASFVCETDALLLHW